jgi:GxxExxY protein
MGEIGRSERNYQSDRLTESIIARVIKVHQTLGPGFLESIYKRALILEFARNRIECEVEKEVIVQYEGVEVGRHLLDLLVERRVIVELKAVQELSLAHYHQLRSYLKATGLRVGLLINFAKAHADYRRVEL